MRIPPQPHLSHNLNTYEFLQIPHNAHGPPPLSTNEHPSTACMCTIALSMLLIGRLPDNKHLTFVLFLAYCHGILAHALARMALSLAELLLPYLPALFFAAFPPLYLRVFHVIEPYINEFIPAMYLPPQNRTPLNPPTVTSVSPFLLASVAISHFQGLPFHNLPAELLVSCAMLTRYTKMCPSAAKSPLQVIYLSLALSVSAAYMKLSDPFTFPSTGTLVQDALATVRIGTVLVSRAVALVVLAMPVMQRAARGHGGSVLWARWAATAFLFVVDGLEGGVRGPVSTQVRIGLGLLLLTVIVVSAVRTWSTIRQLISEHDAQDPLEIVATPE